jgi:thioredoxin-dependent peroxiredoxin
VSLQTVLRSIVATTAATALGLTRALYSMTSSDATHRVALEPGDVAPDFTLPASDGQTYRLADLLGAGIVVVAWFPKAFTGG